MTWWGRNVSTLVNGHKLFDAIDFQVYRWLYRQGVVTPPLSISIYFQWNTCLPWRRFRPCPNEEIPFSVEFATFRCQLKYHLLKIASPDHLNYRFIQSSSPRSPFILFKIPITRQVYFAYVCLYLLVCFCHKMKCHWDRGHGSHAYTIITSLLSMLLRKSIN